MENVLLGEIRRLKKEIDENKNNVNKEGTLKLILDILNEVETKLILAPNKKGCIDFSNLDLVGRNSAIHDTNLTDIVVSDEGDIFNRECSFIFQYCDIRILKIKIQYLDQTKSKEYPLNDYRPNIIIMALNQNELGKMYPNIHGSMLKKELDLEKLKKVIENIFTNNDYSIDKMKTLYNKKKEHLKPDFDSDFSIFYTEQNRARLINSIVDTLKFLVNFTYLL